jgi:mannose/fructose/N-acetylgalactosamine-specific phosphotransferase system component IID
VIVGFMLAANIGLFFWDWNELKILFNQPYNQKIKTFENDIIWQIIGLMLFLFTFFYRLFVDKYDAIFWLSICFIIGIVGLVFGLKKFKKL